MKFQIELIPAKCCTKCKVWLPATMEYWYKNKQGKYGLKADCKNCRNLATKMYQLKNEEKESTRNKLYRANNKRKISECNRVYRINNREKRLELLRVYRINNKEKCKNLIKKWSKENPESSRLSSHKYRTLKKSLPHTLTLEQIEYLKFYFKSKCAACNSTDNLHLDHWIPLTNENCLGTIVTNMVLLCQHCNISKGGKLPAQWLMQKFNNGYFALAIYIKV